MILAFGRESAPVWVEVTEPELAHDIEGLFKPLRLEGRDGDGSPLMIVDRDGAQWIVREPPGAESPPERFQRIPDLLALVEHRLALGLLATYADHTHLHAAGTVVAGRALVALGSSGAGKSSLALAWSLAGYPLLGDDAVLLAEDGRTSAFPRLVKVDQERLLPAGIAVLDTVAPDPDAPEAWHDPSSAGGWARGSFDVGMVASVQFVPGEKTHVHVMGEADTVRVLLDESSELGAPPEDSLDRFVYLARSACAVQVTFGDAFDAAQVLIGELEAAPA